MDISVFSVNINLLNLNIVFWKLIFKVTLPDKSFNFTWSVHTEEDAESLHAKWLRNGSAPE